MKVELLRYPDPDWCPVKALVDLRESQKAAGMLRRGRPIFRLGSGQNLTVSCMSRCLTKLTRHNHMRGMNITASSFRSGVPTDMACRPDLFGDTHIRSWGRWRSDAYRRYMKCGPVRNREIYEKLCAMLSKNI